MKNDTQKFDTILESILDGKNIELQSLDMSSLSQEEHQLLLFARSIRGISQYDHAKSSLAHNRIEQKLRHSLQKEKTILLQEKDALSGFAAIASSFHSLFNFRFAPIVATIGLIAILTVMGTPFSNRTSITPQDEVMAQELITKLLASNSAPIAEEMKMDESFTPIEMDDLEVSIEIMNLSSSLKDFSPEDLEKEFNTFPVDSEFL